LTECLLCDPGLQVADSPSPLWTTQISTHSHTGLHAELGDRAIGAVTTDDLEAFHEKLRGERAGATCNHYRQLLLALQWRDVDLERRELRIRTENTKDQQDRDIPISTRLAAALEMAKLDPEAEEYELDAYAPFAQTELTEPEISDESPLQDETELIDSVLVVSGGPYGTSFSTG
jgi:hypothetical protein